MKHIQIKMTSHSAKFSLLELDMIENVDSEDRYMPVFQSVVEKMKNNLMIDSEDISTALSEIQGIKHTFNGEIWSLTIEDLQSLDKIGTLEVQISGQLHFSIAARGEFNSWFEGEEFSVDNYQDLVIILQDQIESFKQIKKIRNVAVAIDELKSIFFSKNENAVKEDFARFLGQLFGFSPIEENKTLLQAMNSILNWSDNIMNKSN
jgi:hypothetical protein